VHGIYIKTVSESVRLSVKTLLYGVGYEFSAGFTGHFEAAVESNHTHYLAVGVSYLAKTSSQTQKVRWKRNV
jgi:hypothetical protein